MGFTRSRPVGHWLDFPNTTYGLVGSPEYSNWDDGIAYADASLPADYVVWVDSGVAHAHSTAPGGTDYTGTDPAAMVQSAITALGAGGGTILLKGSMTWQTVPGISPGVTGKLRIIGTGNTITLSSTAPRFLDLVRTADHQTFQNIEIGNVNVNCNSLASANHVIVGTFIAGVNSNRYNVDKLYIHDIRAYNIPSDTAGANYRAGIYIYPLHLAVGEGTQNTIKNVLVERVRIEGGNAGIQIGASGATSVNVFHDNITLRDCWHDTGTVPTSSVSGFSLNYMLVAKGFGGKALIQNCYGANSFDVGIETDGLDECVIENVTIDDARNYGFYTTNFHAPRNINASKLTYRNCVARRTNANLGENFGGHGWGISPSNSNPFGRIVLRDCKFEKTTADYMSANGCAVYYNSTPYVKELVIDGFRADVEGWSFSGTTGTTGVYSMFFLVGSGSDRNSLVMRDVSILNNGTYVVGTGVGYRETHLVMLGGSYSWIDLNNIAVDITISTPPNASVFGVTLGYRQALNVTAASIRRLGVANYIGDGNPKLIYVGATTNTTINRRVVVEDCDFRFLVAGQPIGFVSDNKNKIHAYRNIWQTYPAAAAAITPTGSPYAYQNLDNYPEKITVQGGTVSKIEYSVDGTAYTDIGTTAGATLVEPGDYLRVTYSVVPTMTKIPVR